MTRQKLVGWILIGMSTAWLVYFVRVRLLMPGPFLERREWINLFMFIGLLMIGTINVRLAAKRERERR